MHGDVAEDNAVTLGHIKDSAAFQLFRPLPFADAGNVADHQVAVVRA